MKESLFQDGVLCQHGVGASAWSTSPVLARDVVSLKTTEMWPWWH